MSLTTDRLVICETEEYQVDLEYNREYLVLHLPRVDKFNKSVLGKLQVLAEQYEHFSKITGYGVIYAASPMSDNKLPRLLEKLGFVYWGEDLNYRLYRRG
tara:strand:- start:136 stop:435 length:300 start_codon:yes stop_codon:yes gene_type:complete